MEPSAAPPAAPSTPDPRLDAYHRTPDGTLRRELWPRIADDMRVPNHYAALLALAGETPETAQQIEKDLPRTGATFAVQGLLKPRASRPLSPSGCARLKSNNIRPPPSPSRPSLP